MGNYSATQVIVFLVVVGLLVGLLLAYGGGFFPPMFAWLIGLVALIVVVFWALAKLPGAGPLP